MAFFTSGDEKKAEHIHQTILETLEKQGNRVYDLKTEFKDGVVTLSGVCDSEAARKKVILCAQLADGVQQVVSEPLILSDAAGKTAPAAAPQAAPTAPAAPRAETPPEPQPTPAAPIVVSASAPEPVTPAAPIVVSASAPEPVTPAAPIVVSASAPEPVTRSVPQAEPVQSPAAVQMYTIQAGDTLSKIARQFYGNANKYMVIFEANRDVLKNPDRIYPGQEIRIPPLS